MRLQAANLGVASRPLDTVDVLPPPAGVRYFSVDGRGLVYKRTPGEVLYLAFGNRENGTAGGFFPNGVNGAIQTSTAAARSNVCVQ